MPPRLLVRYGLAIGIIAFLVALFAFLFSVFLALSPDAHAAYSIQFHYVDMALAGILTILWFVNYLLCLCFSLLEAL